MLGDNSRTVMRAIYALNAIRWRLGGVQIDLSKEWPTIANRVRIQGRQSVELGARAAIAPYATLRARTGRIIVGARSTIGEFSFINSAGAVTIGSGVMIAPGCHVTDANHEMSRSLPIRSQGRRISEVTIGDDVWIAAGVKILAGVHIGKGAVVGAGAVVTRDVEEYAIVAGVPARPIGSRPE